jgi:hypothetical protein
MVCRGGGGVQGVELGEGGGCGREEESKPTHWPD